MNTKICYGSDEIDITLPDDSKVMIAKQQDIPAYKQPLQAVVQALDTPIGSPRLSFLARKYNKALILVTDFTRAMPYPLLLPPLIDEIRAGGITERNIRILIASGTHRPMTEQELIEHLGQDIVSRFAVWPHEWWKSESLCNLGYTKNGTPITVNKLLVEDSLLVGVGVVKPHRDAGWSGGAKIIQPGTSGNDTTGATHWLAAQYSCEEILGVTDNPVREEIEEIASRVGLDFILNCVQDESHHICYASAGDFIAAHRDNVNFARPYYTIPFSCEADIFIAGSSPVQQSMWSVGSGPNWAQTMMKKGGAMLLASRCPNGICPEHPEIEQFGYLPREGLQNLIRSGRIKDLAAASHMQHGGEKIFEKDIHVTFFCDDLSKEQINNLSFTQSKDFSTSVSHAVSLAGPAPNIIIYPGYDFTTLIPQRSA